MTVKRDFKRRVRQRQARTGESYVTARRHMLASRPGGEGDGDEHTGAAASTATAAPQPAIDEVRQSDRAAGDGPADDRFAGEISVVELVDVSEEARRAGLVCRALMYPPLPERIAPERALTRLREVLIAMVGDPATAVLSALALAGQPPPPAPGAPFDADSLGRLLQRARAGLGGALDDGTALAFHVATGDRLLPILCAASARGAVLELSSIEDLVPEAWIRLGRSLPTRSSGARSPQGLELVEAVHTSLGAHPGPMPFDPPLFILHGGQRQTVTRTTFVIGRAAAGVHLALDAANVAHRHAAVILTRGIYYLKDLDGAVFHKGMQIDTKRIEEGDVFQIGDTEIRFTYQPG